MSSAAHPQVAAAAATRIAGVGPAAIPPAVRSFEAQWRSRPRDALSELRERALKRFVELGLPSMRDESWHYTNLRSIAAQSFTEAAQPQGAPRLDPASLLVPANASTLILVNGHLVQSASVGGLEIMSLRELARTDPEALTRCLEPLPEAEEARWQLLNTALFEDGLYLKVHGAVSVPVVVLHIGSADQPGSAAHPRLILEASPGASVTLLEHHFTQGGESPLINSTSHLALGRGARIEHYRVFASGEHAVHFDSLEVRQQRDSECRQLTVALGGGLVRASLEARLEEPGARIESYALLTGHERRHVDCVNVVRHGAPHTQSRQTARTIASGTSRVIFNSKVVVEAGASGSDSQQSARGLLLSPTAEIDARPQLEIHTDEVKAAHGATTGRLDPNMLFYMLSRGLDRATAQSLLVYAFLADVLTGVSVPQLRSSIESALIQQLPDSQTLRNFR
jgi:Fe-S cluster assembly protein SufD